MEYLAILVYVILIVLMAKIMRDRRKDYERIETKLAYRNVKEDFVVIDGTYKELT